MNGGQKISKLYAKGDVWTLNDIYLNYQKYHPSIQPNKYPPAFIYYAGDCNQESQLYQYDLSIAKFNVIYQPSIQQIRQTIEK